MNRFLNIKMEWIPGQARDDKKNMCNNVESNHTNSFGSGLFILPLFLLMLSTACIPKKNVVSDASVRKAQIPIFIEMPRNVLAFDNITPILYQSLHQHFLRVGYVVTDKQSDGYTLRSNITKFESINKLVSPEVVLAHYTLSLDLEVTLLNFNQKPVIQKVFHLSSLISRPRNPILKSDFVEYEYTRLCNRSAPRIEHFFRPHVLKAFDEDKI